MQLYDELVARGLIAQVTDEDEIKEMINTEILIVTDDKNVFWQQPEEVRTYIKENLEYAGEIEQFSIYKTK